MAVHFVSVDLWWRLLSDNQLPTDTLVDNDTNCKDNIMTNLSDELVMFEQVKKLSTYMIRRAIEVLEKELKRRANL